MTPPAELIAVARQLVARTDAKTAGVWPPHHHPYELPPATAELEGWLSVVQGWMERAQ